MFLIKNCLSHCQVGEGLDLVTGSGLNEYNLYAPCEVPKPSGYVYNNNSFVYDLPSFSHQTHPYMIQKLNVSLPFSAPISVFGRCVGDVCVGCVGCMCVG